MSKLDRLFAIKRKYSGTFDVYDSNLVCIVCDKIINFDSKHGSDTIKKHLRSSGHQKRSTFHVKSAVMLMDATNDYQEKDDVKQPGMGDVPELDFTIIQQLICSIIPPLSYDLHKGQSGRIGIIGGCKEYTGAPYFAAISSLKTGADLSYVFCTHDAAQVIKSYSPELIVYPVLDSPSSLEQIMMHMPKLHSLVIGPGLGRSEALFSTIGGVINKGRELDIPMILDADSLYFINKCPEIIRGYKKAILTPNMAEFDRLYCAVYRCEPPNQSETIKQVRNLCKTLGGITIIRKGPEDIISDGECVITCNEEGSPRRCGGQGDLLCGSMGVFSCWSHKAFTQGTNLSAQKYGPTIIAAMAAAMLIRRCNKMAFSKLGRSTTTTDMISEIRSSFSSLFPVD